MLGEAADGEQGRSPSRPSLQSDVYCRVEVRSHTLQDAGLEIAGWAIIPTGVWEFDQ